MSTLITFPGRAGDIFWMLPSARCISECLGEPVDLQIAGEFASLIPLLAQQPYIDCVHAQEDWSLTHGWEPPSTLEWARQHQRVYHLGYRRWPEMPLPFETWNTVSGGFLRNIDLTRPWITVEGPGAAVEVAVGFTEAWFELKLGLLVAMETLYAPPMVQLTPFRSRWTMEVPPATAAVLACDWLDAARAIRNSDVFFGDCAALHVLAVAMGRRAVIMEPMTARLNSIFWPCGQDGPQVTLVRGLDGQSTFDARHCADALKEALRG